MGVTTITLLSNRHQSVLFRDSETESTTERIGVVRPSYLCEPPSLGASEYNKNWIYR